MTLQIPSIQSFYDTRAADSNTTPCTASASSPRGDGFTTSEVDAVLHPKMDASWLPTPSKYQELDIASLVPGPHCVTFKGRITNFFDQATPSKRPRAAKGCVKLIIKDDTGALTVRLWYANMEYSLRLGQLVSIWTVHVSSGEHGQLASPAAPLFTSIFPERDRSCHFLVYENGDGSLVCRTPVGYRDDHALPGLMTLKNFVDGGYDVADSKILVCVRSIGARKRVPSKKNPDASNELVSVTIFDDTADAHLSLWASQALSASAWKPSHTILLLTSPGCRLDRKAWLSITSTTLIDIDPCIPDAAWLRAFAQRLLHRDHVNPHFPSALFDLAAASSSPNQILFTLADLDEFARAAAAATTSSAAPLYGFLSLVLLELHLVTLHRRAMLLCAECCGVALFANAASATCKQCGEAVALGVNPKVLGTVVDETGCVAPGKLILAPAAWEQMLGRSAEELACASVELLRDLESRMLFLRVTVRFAWVAEMGRICVWEVRV